MSKPAIASKESALNQVEQLIEISKLDTLYKDLYLQRARTLLATTFSRGSYIQLKENSAQIPWVEQQLRAGVERGDWKRCTELTERLRQLRASVDKASQSGKLGETVYQHASEISIDPFSSGLNVLIGISNETLRDRRAEALNRLLTLERTDPENRNFYTRRISDFKRLTIASIDTPQKPETQQHDPGQLQQAALIALEAGDLSRLDAMLASFKSKTEAKPQAQGSVAVELAEVGELGDDLLYTFSEQTLAAARELGLTPVRTESRRKFAYLIPHGWQPSFRKDEVKKWSKEKLSRLTYPEGTTDGAREAIEFFLLNPFISSAGTRYHVCLVAEDLLLENFPEPDARDDVPSKLLDMLKLNGRWGVPRVEIEDALQEHGSEIVQTLHLDPEVFRVTAIPPDIYTLLGLQFGWGQKEMWTHFDGYRVLEGGRLQALAGGDKRFGGTHDVVSFSTDYASAKVFARFAVVQRKRMRDWQTQ